MIVIIKIKILCALLLFRFVESAQDPSTDPVVVWMVSYCTYACMHVTDLNITVVHGSTWYLWEYFLFSAVEQDHTGTVQGVAC